MCPPCDRRHTDPLTTPRSAPITLCSALHSGQTTTLREKGRNPGYLRAQTVTFWGLRTISSNLRAISRTHAPLSALSLFFSCQPSQGRDPADPGQHRDRRGRRVFGYPWKGGTEEGGGSARRGLSEARHALRPSRRSYPPLKQPQGHTELAHYNPVSFGLRFCEQG